MVTDQQIKTSTGCTEQIAVLWEPYLNSAMAEFGIDTPKRQAAFLAQIGHESGHLVYTKELWGPTPAQRRYEGRDDLGNDTPGDGYKFRGRGLIQITGRANFRKCGKELGLDLEHYPEILQQRDQAARSAAWFWKKHHCNELADVNEFRRITLIINGGLNGYAERLGLWGNAKAAFGIA